MAYLYLVRHGETQINAQGRFNGGGVDTPLTDKGVASARTLGAMLRPLSFRRIVVSPQARAIRTAKLIVGADAPLRVDERLREMRLGDWDGQTGDFARSFTQYDDYFHHPDRFDGHAIHAETYQELVDRASAAYQDAVAGLGTQDRVLIVAHGILLSIVSRVLIGTPLGQTRDAPLLANTSVSVLQNQTGDPGWRRLAWGVTPAALADEPAPVQQLFKEE
ncbi:histidine phosphatase family protein [Lacticaseibacillus thailandensis]|uniref:histidine phosphatase family protein n=1 Tax=Lacticaseibacillus thailandensis TaxID=381741 RepID=UPI0006CFB42B|nr:histidine phosphatase family protein [Lacticaseibacillus thailandensis]